MNRRVDGGRVGYDVAGGHATLTGGLNIYMFAKEREARIAAETQLAEERKSKDELLEEFREESKAERRRSDERLSEERRRSDETQQVLLAAVTDLTSKIAELAERNTGNGPTSGRPNGQ